jgi:RimJ/RimL family protein N-acetyltransferase
MIAAARHLPLVMVHAHCHPDNRASVRVLEKCGFTLDRRLRSAHVFPNIDPRPQDVLSYVRTL